MSTENHIALLIDADNSPADKIDEILDELAKHGVINIRRAYGNWKSPALRSWEAVLHQYAIQPIQQFAYTKGKNATDMKITIDAMDLLYGGRVDGFGFMTSDSDFMPIAMRIRQNGLPVYGFGSSKAPEAFQQACTRFIDVMGLRTDEEHNGHGAAQKPVVDGDPVKLLGEAWKASKRDENGYARLTELGQRVANRSSFDARSYGFSRLSELIESLPNFATEKRANGVYVRRVR